jgi:M-phase inducer phosphatase 2
LIGDFSKPFCLPLIDGRHQDLKSISCDTLAGLINGQFDATVGSFQIIDCRYPYEFEGGHIRDAKNLYTHEDIIDELVKNKTELAPTAMPVNSTMFTAKRNILIFHCEFSSERGPKL